MSERAIVVFARAPAEEAQHKPLVELAGRAAREALHLHLLERALATAARVEGADVALVTTGDVADARRIALRHVPAERLTVRLQEGRGFGERYRNAVEGELARSRHVVVIGADTAELEAAHLEAAFAALDRAPDCGAVLGPSFDGGYYLLGLTRFSAAAFEGIAFGGRDVAAATTTALLADGFQLVALPRLGDLDRVEDARALLRRLERSDRALRAALVALLRSDALPDGTVAALVLLRIHSSLTARGPPHAPR